MNKYMDALLAVTLTCAAVLCVVMTVKILMEL